MSSARKHLYGTLAALAIGTGLFTLGLEMGQNIESTSRDRDYAEILVGVGCDGADPAAMVLMSEEDGWGMPCKEITRERVAFQSLSAADIQG